MKKIHKFKPFVSTTERAEVAKHVKYGITAEGIEDEQYLSLDEGMQSYFEKEVSRI